MVKGRVVTVNRGKRGVLYAKTASQLVSTVKRFEYLNSLQAALFLGHQLKAKNEND